MIPGGVASGGLDLYDLGTGVGEEEGGKGTGPSAAEVEDSEAGADFGSHGRKALPNTGRLVEAVESGGVGVADFLFFFVGAVGEDFGEGPVGSGGQVDSRWG